MSTQFLILVRNSVVAVAVSVSATAAQAKVDESNGWTPAPTEITELPPYCQAQFVASLKGQPTPRTYCGVFMNHFCPGLVLINRASRFSGPKNIRLQIVQRARAELEYTRRNLPPNCVLLPDINGADTRLRVLETFVK